MKSHILFKLFNIKFPFIQAPMAGGACTPSFVSSVCNSGALGFLASGYQSPTQLEQSIIATQKLTSRIFGVNIFLSDNISNVSVTKSSEILSLEKKAGIQEPIQNLQVSENEQVDQKIDVILKNNVKIVSFTFGIPTQEQLQKLQANSVFTVGTACTLEEALIAQKSGLQSVVLQGAEAGGHRGSFTLKNQTEQSDEVGLIPLLQAAQKHLKIPYFAAGGINSGQAILATRALGAQGVQIGTGFLVTEESGASSATKQAILNAKGQDTVFTYAISGKKARGIRNQIIDTLEKSEIASYPIQNSLTKDLRAYAGKNQLTEYQSLWSGQGIDVAKQQSVESLINQLAQEYEEALEKLKQDSFF